MHFSFEARVWKWPGDLGWFFVSVPKDIYKEIKEKKGKGLIRTEVTVGETVWKTSLLPHTLSGTYLLALKASVRKKEEIFEGDTVSLSIKVL